MKFSAATVAAIAVVSSTSAFTITSPATTTALRTTSSSSVKAKTATAPQQCSARHHAAPGFCSCPRCISSKLFSTPPTSLDDDNTNDAAAAAAVETAVAAADPETMIPTITTVEEMEEEEEDVPAVVEAMDGVESDTEAHNMDRPARKSIAKKHRVPAKPLNEFTIGDTVTGIVKTLTSYGAFIDIGAETDGLLHISNLSSDYISDVKEILQPGQECSVRILDINTEKKQLALTMLTAEAEESQQAKKQQQSANATTRRAAGGGATGSSSRTNAIILDQLKELDIDPTIFVTGKVVSIVDFGAFVRIDCSQFDEAMSGEFDGLVHISALSNDRVGTVTDVVQEGQEVQVRLMRIDGQKVALAMVSSEDMENNNNSSNDSYGGGRADETEAEDAASNKEWKQDYDKIMETLPVFRNSPMVVTSTRKKKSKQLVD